MGENRDGQLGVRDTQYVGGFEKIRFSEQEPIARMAAGPNHTVFVSSMWYLMQGMGMCLDAVGGWLGLRAIFWQVRLWEDLMWNLFLGIITSGLLGHQLVRTTQYCYRKTTNCMDMEIISLGKVVRIPKHLPYSPSQPRSSATSGNTRRSWTSSQGWTIL